MKHKKTVYSLRIVIDGQAYLCARYFGSREELNSAVFRLAELFSGKGKHKVSIRTEEVR